MRTEDAQWNVSTYHALRSGTQSRARRIEQRTVWPLFLPRVGWRGAASGALAARRWWAPSCLLSLCVFVLTECLVQLRWRGVALAGCGCSLAGRAIRIQKKKLQIRNKRNTKQINTTRDKEELKHQAKEEDRRSSAQRERYVFNVFAFVFKLRFEEVQRCGL